uniref:lysozyme n=1 Tax=Homalodisca liturata TaxID=320908 RepID=A0A1B6K342_9HEMI
MVTARTTLLAAFGLGLLAVTTSLLYERPAYESCAMDPNCATSTVFNYMSRFARDCNGDGSVTCDDYARIHYLGGNQCSVPIHNYAYYRIFRQCMSQANTQGTS